MLVSAIHVEIGQFPKLSSQSSLRIFLLHSLKMQEIIYIANSLRVGVGGGGWSLYFGVCPGENLPEIGISAEERRRTFIL